MDDRPNSLLTSSQREKLVGDDGEEYTRQHRQRMRERTRNGTTDLALLFEHMEERDIKQIFKPDREALKETAGIIKEIASELGHPHRRSHLDNRHALQEISDMVQQIIQLADRQTRIEEDLSAINESGGIRGDNQQQETKREELRMDLEDVSVHQEDLVNDLQLQLEDFEESLQEQVDMLQRSIDRFEQIPYQDLSKKRQGQLDTIRDQLIDNTKRSQKFVDVVREVRKDLDYDYVPEEDLLFLQDEIEKRTSRHDPRENRVRSKPELHHRLRHFPRDIQSELEKPEFDPELRDDVIRALAFYFRVSDVLGISTEELIKEAFRTMFDQEHRDEVLDHVVVTSEADNREEAAERASSKPGDERLSNAELRSLAETNPDLLTERYEKTIEVTEVDLVEHVKNNPELLEDGLEIEDLEPKNPDSTAVPDMVARDEDGKIVILEFKTSLTDRARISAQLENFIQDYGGPDRVRGMLVVPASAIEEDNDVSTSFHDSIDVRPIPVTQ